MDTLEDSQYIFTLDDDPSVSRILEKATGFKSLNCSSTKDLSRFVDRYTPVAAFIDIHLGIEDNGLDVIPKLRAKWPYSPLIVITSDLQDESLVEAFKQGADDYLLKPIKPKEVQIRFQTRLADLQNRAARTILNTGDISLDTAHRVVNGPLGRQFLAPIETLILAHLIKSQGTIVSKEVIKREAWGPVRVSDNAYYRKLFELRKALCDVSETVKIQSSYGTGLSLLSHAPLKDHA